MLMIVICVYVLDDSLPKWDDKIWDEKDHVCLSYHFIHRAYTWKIYFIYFIFIIYFTFVTSIKLTLAMEKKSIFPRLI